ncbi:TlpA family protein disulfide reductase [Pedobacter helvus]|uniref:TlpA family protein disulfide reductase n=1 Tax=Pedobacter helvus TaxID=2563444 RepID=A0ABW9JGS4_9SPHI|nr:TlpA disulfide reductase family protein [Pedobacter ureilyticus]
MKKTTMYIVMAVLCPKRLKAKRPKLKAYLPIALLLYANFNAIAQTNFDKTKISSDKKVANSPELTSGAKYWAPLRVGDKLPEAFWQQEHSVYTNGQITKQTLEQYKGKLLILDFWATWCGTCVGKFPITDSLQKENSELKIVLVNSNRKDNAQTLKKFYTENVNAKLHPLPTLVADTILKGMFPHKYVPHYVFIDYRGMVMGFASYHFLNREIIAALLQQHQRLINKRRHEN